MRERADIPLDESRRALLVGASAACLGLESADRTAFFDPKVSRLRARFSATTISPWLKWMDMGEAEGHLVWHTFGEKVFSIHEIPAEYRRHAGPLLDQLTMRPAL